MMQVKQLAWTGEVVHMCGLAGGPPSVLAGALADRLLVARGGPSEACKASSSLMPGPAISDDSSPKRFRSQGTQTLSCQVDFLE